jgi:hypothetical protein
MIFITYKNKNINIQKKKKTKPYEQTNNLDTASARDSQVM